MSRKRILAVEIGGWYTRAKVHCEETDSWLHLQDIRKITSTLKTHFILIASSSVLMASIDPDSEHWNTDL